jgi:hypothetical protein
VQTDAVREIFKTAKVKRREADETRAVMSAVLLQAMRTLLPEGSILTLDQRPLPEYLVRVRTMAGNDRGSRTFRVVQVVCVTADPYAPELSRWECEAVPLSEKTGKAMSAATHSSNRATVRLHGDVGYLGLDEDVRASRDRLIQLVAANAQAGA